MILIWRYANAYKVILFNAFLEKNLKDFSSMLDFEPLLGPDYWPEVTVWPIYNPIYIIVDACTVISQIVALQSHKISFKLLRGTYFQYVLPLIFDPALGPRVNVWKLQNLRHPRKLASKYHKWNMINFKNISPLLI